MINDIWKIFPNWMYHIDSVDSRTGRKTTQANNTVVRRASTDSGAREMSVRGHQLMEQLTNYAEGRSLSIVI